MPSSCTRLYLGGLPNFVGVEEVSKHLTGYGKLIEVKINQGYGFVEFDKEKDASDVFEIFNKHQFMGTNITVEYARPPRKTMLESDPLENSNNRYGTGSAPTKLRYLVTVANVPRGACWQELKDFGRQAGYVVFCNIRKPQDGTGFIEYTSRTDAHRAVRRLSGKKLCGNVVLLSTREQQNDENYTPKPARERRARSRSPLRDHSLDPSYPTSTFRASFAENSRGTFDPYIDAHYSRGRSMHQQRSHTSTDSSNNDYFFDQIDPHSCDVTSQNFLAPPYIKDAAIYDYYGHYIRGQYEDGELHTSGAGYHANSRWAYI